MRKTEDFYDAKLVHLGVNEDTSLSETGEY